MFSTLPRCFLFLSTDSSPDGAAVENLDQDPTLQAIVPLVVACLIRFHRVRLSLQCPRELTYDRGVACLRGELTEREGRVHEEPAVVARIRLCERGRAPCSSTSCVCARSRMGRRSRASARRPRGSSLRMLTENWAKRSTSASWEMTCSASVKAACNASENSQRLCPHIA